MCGVLPMAAGMGKKAMLGAALGGIPGALIGRKADRGGKFDMGPEDYSSHGPGNEWWRIARREAGYE